MLTRLVPVLVALTVLVGCSPNPARKLSRMPCGDGYVLVHADDGTASCEPSQHPDDPIETQLHLGEHLARATAPFKRIAPGAYASALAQRSGLPVSGAAAWTPVGNAPLYANDTAYSTSKLGWVKLGGRVTSFAADPSVANHFFASTSDGGVYEWNAQTESWTNIGDRLPSQVVGAITYSPARGGMLVVATGDNAIGGVGTVAGAGIYYTTNHGLSWAKGTGVYDGAVSFKIVVDPSDASGKTLYAATSHGLYRSTDAAATWTNVALPTTPPSLLPYYDCAGNTSDDRCFYANIVTDVVVRSPDANGAGGGRVLAAVGWPYGQRADVDGTIQSPQNGLYVSATGAPGSFTFIDPGSSAPSANGFAPTPNVGRVALAVAHGPTQNHDLVYALVSDAQKLNGCLDTEDVRTPCLAAGATATQLAAATTLDGAYVSTDFGAHWQRLVDAIQLRAPGTNSALSYGILGYGPGIQAWYNLWIEADPTATDAATGAPTRLVFGLEEIWENAVFGEPQNGPSKLSAAAPFRVIGRYWDACVEVVSGVNCNGTQVIPGLTTHPDQHAGLFVPDPSSGGVTLLAGNDGGAYLQHVAAGQDFSNDGWGVGASDGMHSLLAYDADISGDGTVVAGLQDNGEAKIATSGLQEMIFGGDGFFTTIHPTDSLRILEEYANGVISVTHDGGKNWDGIDPQLTTPLFSTPVSQDPAAAGHFLTGGRDIEYSDKGYAIHCADPLCQTYDNWTQLFDLGASPVSGFNNQTSAIDLRNGNAYVGFCGPCSVMRAGSFGNGVATNVGGSWHFARRNGLPTRYITSVTMDPANPRTIWVTLGGYSSHWVPPGASGESTAAVGVGHVFRSDDGGDNFVDVSGNLPDVPADHVLVRNGQLIVATDIGVFISSAATTGASWSVLGGNLPVVPVARLRFAPNDPGLLLAATFGRGVYRYHF